jgi:hypothetical protein
VKIAFMNSDALKNVSNVMWVVEDICRSLRLSPELRLAGFELRGNEQEMRGNCLSMNKWEWGGSDERDKSL